MAGDDFVSRYGPSRAANIHIFTTYRPPAFEAVMMQTVYLSGLYMRARVCLLPLAEQSTNFPCAAVHVQTITT